MSDGVRVGVDIGGTFTDVVALNDGELVTEKVPSTPASPADAVTDGIAAAADTAAFDPGAVTFLAHGTTVATNAVLEGEWADTAFLTTDGFRDVLEIGRQARPDIYDLDAEKPAPVVPRHRRHEVPERLDERGDVLTPLDTDAVQSIAADLDDVDSVAICFLFAYENPDHERAAATILREELDVPVSTSATVLPEYREYERSVTTALNAALRPVVADYITQLREDLTTTGVTADLTIMGSNGGVMTADTAESRPVETLLSGPAAGVRGAAHLAGQVGISDLVTMDMGGTSCDVSLVTDGDPTISTSVTVGDYPVGVPMVDVHTVGAGGGSIAWLDTGGALRVGPRSAGADPGPVCYGRGGDQPTTTDAQVLLGRIDPDRLLDAPADRDTVESVVRRSIADPLDTSVIDAASGIVSVANANMERALRIVSVERGYDPRDLTLVAYGGAGPLHAPALAAAMDMPRVLVPPSAGVLSALGLLVSDVATDVASSMVRPWTDLDPDHVATAFTDLERQATETLADADIPRDRRTLERRLDLRYAGQSFDLTVPAPDDIDAAALATIADRFHDRYADRYGHAAPDEPLELVTVRVHARGHVPTPSLSHSTATGDPADAIHTTRPVRFEATTRETPVYDRSRLPIDSTIDGPAVVEGAQSTALVHPGQTATVDDHANLQVVIDP
ncbi:MAG: hydantoinase/oxoprolinase family protein [Halobacteriaceae archaeon]